VSVKRENTDRDLAFSVKRDSLAISIFSYPFNILVFIIYLISAIASNEVNNDDSVD
jgi:hypothetical protein